MIQRIGLDKEGTVMEVNSAIALALSLSRLAHAKQRYGNLPYFSGHVMPVVNRVRSDPRAGVEHVVVAALHDVVEDTAVTLEDVRYQFGPVIWNSVKAITRKEGEPYAEYIRRVSEDDIAAVVKFHDLKENLARRPRPSLRKRYEKAMEAIRVALSN